MLARSNVRSRRTDDRGHYRLFPVRAGEHYVLAGEAASGDASDEGPSRIYYPGTAVVAEAAAVNVVASQDTVGIDITYRRSEGASVHGFAFDASGKPLQAPVTMTESSRGGGPLTARRQAAVGPDGGFAFLNVSPGDYVIQGLVPPNPDRPTEVGVGFITVRGADLPPVIIRTSTGTTVNGRVTLEGDRSKIELEAFGIGANTSDPDFAIAGRDQPGDGVREDGTFQMQLHGPMRIALRAAPQGWWLKSATIGSVDLADQPYTFTGAGEVTLEVVVADSAGSVSGRVTGAVNEPPIATYVILLPADESRRYVGSPHVRFARAASGTYQLPSVPPGDYVIVAPDRFDIANERQDVDVWRVLAPFGQPITVGERQSVTRDLQVLRRTGM
jgi:hypothetical protein